MIVKLIFRDIWLEPRQVYKNVSVCRRFSVIVSRYPECLISIPRRGDANIMIIGSDACKTRCLKLRVASSLNRQFHFEPVQHCGPHIKIKTIFPRYSAYYKSGNHHPKYNQYKSMAPNELENFQASIKNMLKFVNCSYLHKSELFSLIKFRISQNLLKLSKRKGETCSFLKCVAKWSYI